VLAGGLGSDALGGERWSSSARSARTNQSCARRSTWRYAELKETGSTIAIGDARLLVDGRRSHVQGVPDGLFRDIDYRGYPNRAAAAAAGRWSDERCRKLLTPAQLLARIPQQARSLSSTRSSRSIRADRGGYRWRPEPISQGPLPGQPVTPGVLLVESMAGRRPGGARHLLLSKELRPRRRELVTVFGGMRTSSSPTRAARDLVPRPAGRSTSPQQAAQPVEMRLEDAASLRGNHLRHGRAAMSVRVVVTGLGDDRANANGQRDFELALRKGSSGCARTPRCATPASPGPGGGRAAGVDELAAAVRRGRAAGDESNHRYVALRLARGLARRRGSPPSAVTTASIGHRRRARNRLGAWTRSPARVVVRRAEEGPAPRQHLRRAGDGERVSARVSGLLALGNPGDDQLERVQHGTEALAIGAARIRSGAQRMLCGGGRGREPLHLGRLRTPCACSRGAHDTPDRASRPLSERGRLHSRAGSGVLLARESRQRQARGARIYAELLARRSTAADRPRRAQHDGAEPGERAPLHPRGARGRALPASAVDLINGTSRRPRRPGRGGVVGGCPRAHAATFPAITSTKSMIGHVLGAAGAIESVATC